MSNFQWFYADAQQQQQGPVAFEQIQQLAASGQIQPTTLIWNEGMPAWTAASQVQGVFNAGPPPVAAAPFAAAQANPYAAPNTGYPMAGVATGGSYPIPPVKKCSFALYLALFITGIVILIGGFGIFLSDAAEITPAYDSSFQTIETQDDFDTFNENRSMTTSTETPPLKGLVVAGVGGLVLAIASILGFIQVYRAWFILQPGGARTSPGKAVGFMFIPFFNLYWMFVIYHGWSQDWNRIRSSHSNLMQMPPASEGLFLAGPICAIATIVPLVGIIAALAYPILFLIMHAQLCKVVNTMAAASQQPR